MKGDYRLTARQYEILLLIARGYRYSEVADKLQISGQTVKNQMSSVLKRLDARSAAHAVYLVFANSPLKGKSRSARARITQRATQSETAPGSVVRRGSVLF